MDVRTMTPDDEVAAIETVVLAFVADPVTRWVWPGAGQYLTAMPRFVRAFGGNAFARGGAYCSGEYSGAALWLPPGVHPNEDELERLMESTASPPAQEAGSAIFEQMATYHPREPHWYLPLIGVDPAHQSKGHGDALMRYADAPPGNEVRGSMGNILALRGRLSKRVAVLPTYRCLVKWAVSSVRGLRRLSKTKVRAVGCGQRGVPPSVATALGEVLVRLVSR